MAETLGILLISGTHERAHYAFVMAAGAAAIGRDVVVFATNEGCRALLADWRTLEQSDRDSHVQAAGVAGLEELRAASIELGVRLIACDSGLRMAGLDGQTLTEGASVGGVPTFLSAVGTGTIVTL